MKKILWLILMVFGLAINSLNAQTVNIMLKNGSKAETFAYNNIAGACAAAQDGDTLIFTKGTFPMPSDFKVTKKLTFIGVGVETKLTGNITIELAPGTHLDATLFENLWLTRHVIFNSILSDIVFKKVRIKYDPYLGRDGNTVLDDIHYSGIYIMPNLYIDNMVIDRCEICNFDGWNERNLGTQVINSIIWFPAGDCKYVSFNYCLLEYINNGFYTSSNIPPVYTGSSNTANFSGHVENSIIRNSRSTNSEYRNIYCPMRYCLYNEEDLIISGVTLFEHNYNTTDGYINKLTLRDPEKAYELITSPNNYYSSDGITPVGPFGGVTPFDPYMTPSGPIVPDFEIQTDKDKNEIRVKLTVTTKE